MRVLDENALPEQRNKVFNVHVRVLRHDVLHQAVEHFRATLHIGVGVCGELAVLRRAAWSSGEGVVGCGGVMKSGDEVG